MFLQLVHTRTPVFQESKKLTLECHRNTRDFPADERFAMLQIRRAALSVISILLKVAQENAAQR